LAPIERSPATTVVHSALADSQPVQPRKAYPAAGAAVTVSAVPSSTVAEQVEPQLIPPAEP
jgi:hypothetical protein